MNTSEIRDSLQRMLGPVTEPVAVTFCDAASVGIARAASAAPAGRSYWKLAAEGGVFYTVADDHMNALSALTPKLSSLRSRRPETGVCATLALAR